MLDPAVVIFDACVLYPFHLRNIVVQLAVGRLVDARWTSDTGTRVDYPHMEPPRFPCKGTAPALTLASLANARRNLSNAQVSTADFIGLLKTQKLMRLASGLKNHLNDL